MLRRSGNEVLARNFAAEAVEHTGFGDNDDIFCRRLFAIRHHLLGRANFVGQYSHRRRAFRMRNQRRARMFFTNLANTAGGELDVDITSAIP